LGSGLSGGGLLSADVDEGCSEESGKRDSDHRTEQHARKSIHGNVSLLSSMVRNPWRSSAPEMF